MWSIFYHNIYYHNNTFNGDDGNGTLVFSGVNLKGRKDFNKIFKLKLKDKIATSYSIFGFLLYFFSQHLALVSDFQYTFLESGQK